MPKFSFKSLSISLFFIIYSSASLADDFCHSKWLKPGTQIKTRVDGNATLMSFEILKLKHDNKTSCHAEIQFKAKSKIDFFTINGSGLFTLKADPNGVKISGNFNSKGFLKAELKSKITTHMTNGYYLKPSFELTGHEKKLTAYQSVANVNGGLFLTDQIKLSSLSVNDAGINTNKRKVGNLENTNTALGVKQCHPISYQATTNSGAVVIKKLNINKIPKSKKIDITEWYCPSEEMILKMVLRSKKHQSIFEVTEINIP